MAPETDLPLLIDRLEGYVSTLDRYAREVPRDRFLSSEDEQNRVLFGLHKVIQTALDIASVLVAVRRLGPAETYKEAFDKLVAAGLIEPDLGARLAGWAGLRNVIVHIYRIIDLEQIYTAYTQETDDIRAYIEALRRLPEART